ncbi:MAG: hypothetical protein NVSMB55_25600 [Mycobacteriales bacterium]
MPRAPRFAVPTAPAQASRRRPGETRVMGAVSESLGLTLDVPALVLTTGLAAGYAALVGRVRARGLSWPIRRSGAWALGLVSLLVATVGGIGRHAPDLLWVFTVQILVLLLLTPVLLAYGRPLALAADGWDHPRARRLLLVATGRGVRLTTSPLVGPLLVPVVLAAVFFSPVLAAVLTMGWAAQLLRLGLLGVGLLIAVGLVGDGTEQDTSLQLGAAVAVGFAEFLLDAVPGIVIRLRSSLLAPPGWAGLHRHGGLSPLADQQRAGALLWFMAEVADLPFLLILLRRWIRADERDAARVDRELDMVEGHVVEASVVGGGEPGPGPSAPADPASAVGRPWWETDASRLGGHRLAAELADRQHAPRAEPRPDPPRPSE